MGWWFCFFSRRVDEVTLERKSPVLILTMASSAVPHPRIPPVGSLSAGLVTTGREPLNVTPACPAINRQIWLSARESWSPGLLTTGMVVDDPPALGELAEDQREQSVRLFAIGEREAKLATNKSALRPEHVDLQVGELQLTHLGMSRLIVLAITLQRGLPALGFLGARKECQTGRVPVSEHETFEIVLIPGFDLGFEHLPNGSLLHLRFARLALGQGSGGNSGRRHEQNRNCTDASPHPASVQRVYRGGIHQADSKGNSGRTLARRRLLPRAFGAFVLGQIPIPNAVVLV